MVIKEFTWARDTVRLLLLDIRSTVKVHTKKFPGAAPHRVVHGSRGNGSRKTERG